MTTMTESNRQLSINARMADLAQIFESYRYTFERYGKEDRKLIYAYQSAWDGLFDALIRRPDRRWPETGKAPYRVTNDGRIVRPDGSEWPRPEGGGR